jgi:hypothetical protein
VRTCSLGGRSIGSVFVLGFVAFHVPNMAQMHAALEHDCLNMYVDAYVDDHAAAVAATGA